ncbi:MAG: hypothetical protein L3J29_09630 [Cyclobacteriaceae bacterium]|nr:hypothetical protein [Cyclobacteriaceae bacterium]
MKRLNSLSHYKTLLFYLLILSFVSCECGESVNLGDLPLEEGSLDFLTYDGSEKLVFIDEKSEENVLFSKGDSILFKLNVYGEKECDKGRFDKKNKYYLKDNYEVYFYDKDDNYVFHLNITTKSAAETEEAEFILFDILSVDFYKTTSLDLDYIISDRGNQIPDSYKNNLLNLPTFIGDTTLFNKPFKEVYFVKDKYGENPNSILFYNFQKGLIAIQFDTEKFWVLDRIE